MPLFISVFCLSYTFFKYPIFLFSPDRQTHQTHLLFIHPLPDISEVIAFFAPQLMTLKAAAGDPTSNWHFYQRYIRFCMRINSNFYGN